MYYDEPEGCDGDMRQYEGLDMSEFQPPTDEEYRAAYAECLTEEASGEEDA